MGHSFGGVIAFEIAQQLQAQGQEVALLALLDSYISRRRKLLPIRHRLSNLLKIGFTGVLERVKGGVASKFQRLRYGRQYLPYLYYLAGETHLFEDYAPKAYTARVTLFKAMDEFSVSYSVDSPEVGWNKFVTGSLEIYDVTGDHIGILEEPHVQVLAERLKFCIDKALGNDLEGYKARS
jgi:aspartate racemase